MGRRYLELASNRLFWTVGDEFVYPYVVDVSVDRHPPMIGLGEGVTHGAAWGAFSVAEALQEHWARHFELAHGIWLLPYLRRLVAGGNVSESELVAEFVRQHGRPPEVLVSRTDWSS